MTKESQQPSNPERAVFLFEAHKNGHPFNVDVRDVAALTGVSVSRLNLFRLTGGGPRFMKFGRSVRYRLSEVIEWMNRPSYSSTSEISVNREG